MAALNVSAVLQKHLPKFDEELLDYITAIVEEMSLEEKRSHNSLHEVMGPFIVDTGAKSHLLPLMCSHALLGLCRGLLDYFWAGNK